MLKTAPRFLLSSSGIPTSYDVPAPPIVAHPLFLLDYDGTLAPLVDDPAEAVPHPDVPALLDRLAAHHPVVIVTGRHLRDVSGFLPDLAVEAVGLHGAQAGPLGGPFEEQIPEEARQALAAMRATVPEGEGLRVEDKGHTFAVHYRHAPDRAAARQRLEAWAAATPDVLAATSGKLVVELRPAALSKGTAVAEIAARHAGRTPLYLGDDVTDEDAFAALPEAAVTIKIGEGETRARYRLPNVDAVARYLEKYVEG